MNNISLMLKRGTLYALFALVIAIGCGACASHVAISGREESSVVLTNSYQSVRYDGCFWKNDLWEESWQDKKSRRQTLKIVRMKIYPWQVLASAATLGVWVPIYVDWELNGDKK